MGGSVGGALKTVGSQFGLGGGGAAGDAMKAGFQANKNAANINKEALAASQKAYNPYIQLGANTTNAIGDQLGLNGVGAQQTAFDNYRMSPGQAFLQAQGEKALMRNAAATGNLGGGGTKIALQDRAQQFAMTDYANYYNRLAGQQGIGMNALNNSEQLRAQYSGANAGLANERGQIAASGILGQEANKVSGLNNLVTAAGGATQAYARMYG